MDRLTGYLFTSGGLAHLVLTDQDSVRLVTLPDGTRSHIVARLAAETAPLHLMGVPSTVEAVVLALDLL